MRAFRTGVALIFFAVMMFGPGSIMASEEYGDPIEEWESKYDRLLRFAVEVIPWEEDEGWFDAQPANPSYLYLTAETYKDETPNATGDTYSSIESLTLTGFNQSQFEEIVTQAPALRYVTLRDCNVNDFSPLQPIADRLTLSFSWEPDLLDKLAVLPNLYAIELDTIPNASLSELCALTGLEKMVLHFGHDAIIDISVLGQLPNLRSLELYSRESSLDAVPKMPALEELCLFCDIDAAQLENTPALQKLYFSRYIPDDLTPLYSLPDLTYLEINAVHTHVTDYVEQLEALHEAMPDLKIVLYYCC